MKIDFDFEETDPVIMHIPGLKQEYPTGLKITPYWMDGETRKNLQSFKLSLKKGEKMKLYTENNTEEAIWVSAQSVQPWMIDWTNSSLGNTMSILLIEDMVRSFLTIYLLKQYPGNYISAIDLYVFCMQYAEYISYSNRHDVVIES